VHHDTASARSWVQLRVRVVACTAVDDPPPKQDDGLLAATANCPVTAI
jgi:hypothetical protein